MGSRRTSDFTTKMRLVIFIQLGNMLKLLRALGDKGSFLKSCFLVLKAVIGTKSGDLVEQFTFGYAAQRIDDSVSLGETMYDEDRVQCGGHTLH